MSGEVLESEASPTVMKFDLIKTAVQNGGAAARLGRMALKGRLPVDTPNFFGITSRGVVPHVTPDNVSKHLKTTGAYMALEDFIERPQQYQTRIPPIYETPSSSQKPLHSFTAMPESVTTVLAARRLPAVQSPAGNTNDSISVFTSTGFQVVTTKEYHNAVQALRPDIAVPLADLTFGPITPTSKRAARMAERTEDWIKEWFAELDNQKTDVATFAPVLPVSFSMQWEYLERLAEDHSKTLGGLAVYDADVLPDLVRDYPSLVDLPRLALTAPTNPHQVLRQIALGLDVFLLPFINAASDGGIALSFSFPAPSPSTTSSTTGTDTLPLGIDMSSPSHATDLSPLTEGCPCYACTKHHRAFLTHLLAAREMLGWTLLQLHNYSIVSSFFAGVRSALADGTFESKARDFSLVYDPEIPAGTGERPRARGYHFKSEGHGEAKRNKPAWNSKLGEDIKAENAEKKRLAEERRAAKEAAKKAELGDEEEREVAVDLEALSLQQQDSGESSDGSGTVETPLVPDADADAKDLQGKGFAEIIDDVKK